MQGRHSTFALKWSGKGHIVATQWLCGGYTGPIRGLYRQGRYSTFARGHADGSDDVEGGFDCLAVVRSHAHLKRCGQYVCMCVNACVWGGGGGGERAVSGGYEGLNRGG